MTAPLTQQTVQVKDSAAARKRRRRAPAGGASDDCFTCAKRNVKCDRRRPYCSQCLEIGNECSGYKTQLTWGVGVASRGKLRGLSLPIAKAPPVAREPKKSPVSRARTNTSTVPRSMSHPQPHNHHHHHNINSLQWSDRDDIRLHGAGPQTSRGPMDIPNVSHSPATSAPTTPYGMQGYDYLSLSQPDHTPPMHGSWGSVGYSSQMVHSPEGHARYNKYPLALVTDGLSSSVSSVNSDVDYMSPMSQSYPREELSFVNSPSLIYDNYSTHQSSPAPQSPPQSISIDHSRAPTSYPGLVYTPSDHGSSLGSHHHLDVFESQINPKMMRECDSLNVPGVTATGSKRTFAGTTWTSAQHRHQYQQQSQDDDILSPHSEHSSTAPWSNEPRTVHVSQELVARMPFFMDYYNSTLCPSMVFVDGPGNPFRENIMQLANDSPGLRHAICALSACNLRMRRKLSLGQGTANLSAILLAEKQAAEAVPDTQIEDQTLAEEYQHRNLAVNLLNQQLSDPIKSSHDSVLATILLLCHYRLVESGIAKFNTQFAGVKKILSIRRSQQMTPTGEPSWMEGSFTYLDAISASINDREAQLSAESSDLSPDDHALPAGIENLVGCDRDLFKSIGKLGRLNLMSQHRPVQTPVNNPDELARSGSPFGRPMGRAHRGSIGSYGIPVSDLYNRPDTPRLDGNGYGATLNEDDATTSTSRSSGAYDVHRSAFWKEWREIRLALQNWQFDASAVAARLPDLTTTAQARELGTLSEAFRYAALLYTERLASPTLPSSHSNFRNLVSQVVYYGTSLENNSAAEKFLLWPLFIAGSECVNELQQNIIRTKCRELMSRSGYMNNLSALDILEKLWATELRESESRSSSTRLHIVGRRSPFNWVKCIGGTGTDLEWIMF